MIGSVVLATEQGLGILAKSFYDHGVINKVLIKRHSSRANHYDWYEKSGEGWMDFDKFNYDWFFKDLTAIIFFEDCFDWKLIVMARQRGVKTILMPMYECTRAALPYQPDLIISPSLLDKQYFPDSIFLPVPVDVKWRLRKKAKIFIHNAGNGGLGSRNGTKDLIKAMEWVKSPIKLIIRSQEPNFSSSDPRVEVQGSIPYEDLFTEGDVFIFPEKFNGLSLPLQEAYASGMLVMAGDRFPINTWLPKEPLIPVASYKKERINVEFDSAQYDPQEIAKKIDEFYNKDITTFSRAGREWAKQNSWAILKQKYLKLCILEKNHSIST